MKKLLFVILILFAASSAYAESKFFQASLSPFVGIHTKDTRIKGLILNIWGENPQSAFTLGFFNGSSGDSKGVSWGLVNYADNYTGVEWSVVNHVKGNFKGWQSGFFNSAGRLKGLQLGFINHAKTVESGLQIGVINVIEQNQWFKRFPEELSKGMLLFNWRFK